MERSTPTNNNSFNNKEGNHSVMRKTNINIQDLRRKIYIKAKAEKSWRFWGIYVHVSKLEILEASYMQAKQNNGAPGIDGVTFAEIESAGAHKFLEELRNELLTKTYTPKGHRKHEIPKADGKKRTLRAPLLIQIGKKMKLLYVLIFINLGEYSHYIFNNKNSDEKNHKKVQSNRQTISFRCC